MKKFLTAAVVVASFGAGGAAIAGAATDKPSAGKAATGVFAERLAKQLGISEGDLSKATVAAGGETIAELRKDGRLDAAKAERLQRGLKQRGGAPFTRLGRPAKGAGIRRAALGAEAKALGMKRKDLVRALKAGTAPATIIEQRGKDRAQVARAVRAAVAAKLAKGKVPAERAAKRADKAAARFTQTEPLKRDKK